MQETAPNSMHLSHLWKMGYRPFFLSGMVFGALIILVWIFFYSRAVMPMQPFPASFWHGHEMVYGFALAIIAGFLLTASATWTQTRGLHGNKLMFLFLLWLAARLFFLLSLGNGSLSLVASVLDILFLPVLIGFLSPSLIKAGAVRNMNFLFLLAVFWIGNLCMYFSAWGWIDISFLSRGLYLGAHLVVALLVIIGGRVVPFFTRNALPEAGVRIYKPVEFASFLLIALYVVSDFVFPERTSITGSFAGLLGVVSLARLWGWRPHKTFKVPLLLILHLGYLWLGLGFLLIFFSDLIFMPTYSVALHALTVGSMGVFIVGMVSRVSLGHSGRPLRLRPGMLWSYLAINLAAVVRVVSGFLSGEAYTRGVQTAGWLWVASFLILFVYYAPIYLKARADGREG